jgi:hypothetical protein
MQHPVLVSQTGQPVPADPAWDRAFAVRAAAYLAQCGLSPDEIRRCLVDECGLDQETAQILAA